MIANEVTPVWFIIVSGIFAVATLATVAHRRVGSVSNLGYVSERWLLEYRAEQRGDSL